MRIGFNVCKTSASIQKWTLRVSVGTEIVILNCYLSELNIVRERVAMNYKKAKICLLGDFSEEVLAHQAINLSFARAEESDKLAEKLTYEWVYTRDINSDYDELANQFSQYDAVWIVPASPYENTEGVLNVLRYIRTNSIPFLGTCGGYQHAIIEFARNVLLIEDADHVEVNPDAKSPLIVPLACKLVEKSETLLIQDGTFIKQLYEAEQTDEMYHCSFGFNESYAPLFSTSQMKFVVFNKDGIPRALELQAHPFFIGTSYQPERNALNGTLHPLVADFFRAALQNKKSFR